MKSKKLLNIELTQKEAIVLFSAISKLDQNGSLDAILTGPEKYCVARVQSSLEGYITLSKDDLTVQIMEAQKQIEKHLKYPTLRECRDAIVGMDN